MFMEEQNIGKTDSGVQALMPDMLKIIQDGTALISSENNPFSPFYVLWRDINGLKMNVFSLLNHHDATFEVKAEVGGRLLWSQLLVYIPTSSACSETPGQSNRFPWGCLWGKPSWGESVQRLLAEKERNKKKKMILFIFINTDIL